MTLYNVAADTPSMKKAIGPKLARQFSANPKVTKYAFVLKLPLTAAGC